MDVFSGSFCIGWRTPFALFPALRANFVYCLYYRSDRTVLTCSRVMSNKGRYRNIEGVGRELAAEQALADFLTTCGKIVIKCYTSLIFNSSEYVPRRKPLFCVQELCRGHGTGGRGQEQKER